MAFAWYINRLARMSPIEIAHRVGEQAKRRMSKRDTFTWDRFAEAGAFQGLPAFRDALLRNASPRLRDAIRRSADRLLAGTYDALGVAWPQREAADPFRSDIWRLDPVTGALWPGDRFCFDIAFRHERTLGDIKYVWEFNRLQFLQPLAAAYALFDDREALAMVDRALTSWIDANPPFQGLGWNSGIELALRATSIMLVASLCGEALPATTQRKIGPLLEAHRYWLARFPSRFSSANNHLVAELMGEYLIDACLPDRPSPKPAALLASQLAREAGLQILDDGTPAEQSPTYGAFTAEMLLVCAWVARHLERPLAPIVDQRLGRFADFIAALAAADGRVPAIGDDDEGRVITLSHPHEETYPASVARAITAYLGETTPIAELQTAELRDALAVAHASTAAPDDVINTFSNGGYTIVGWGIAGRRLRLVLDHGPLGYLSIAAHGHADANAIILSVDDQPILVDPGTYLYHSGHEWRDWFRGTRAHNTLTVSGVDQSVIAGPFNWSSRANARLLATQPDGPLEHMTPATVWKVVATHDGYGKRFGVDHRRTIAATAEGCHITDELLPSDGSHDAEIVFQLAAGLAAHMRSQSCCVVSRNGVELLSLVIEAEGAITVFCGGDDLAGGWVSPAFGVKHPAPRIAWKGRIPPGGVQSRISLPPR